MNNLPDRYGVRRRVRDELLYQFREFYDDEFYGASKEKQMHYIAIILEILSYETDEWQGDNSDDEP